MQRYGPRRQGFPAVCLCKSPAPGTPNAGKLRRCADNSMRGAGILRPRCQGRCEGVLDQNSRAGARLTSLYEAHAADAFRYALHLTGRREDAEDVVQHVFLGAYATLETGRDLASPRAWLIKATKHRSLNLLRDRRDAPVGEVDPATACTPAD